LKRIVINAARSLRLGHIWLSISVVAFVASLAVGTVAAQQASEPSSQEAATTQVLLQRIEQLEMTVNELKTQLKQLAEKEAAAPATAGSTFAAVPPAAETQAVDLVRSQSARERLNLNESGIQMRGFGYVGFSATDVKGTRGEFALGDLDLLLTSRLPGGKAKVLSEILFEAGDAGSFNVDVERLLLQVNQNDYLNLGVGRFHTGIGFYNSYFHHGNYMQTTTDRPLMFAFADDGGILPTGNVGITASGKIPSGRLGLSYLAELGGEDTRRTTFNGTEVDLENGNSVNFGVIARPDAWRGFQTGISWFHDSEHPTGLPTIRENILAAHIVLLRPNFEWLNEGLVIRHAPLGSGIQFHTPAFYSQFSYRLGSYRPYIRYQYVNASENDPVLNDVKRREGPSLGLRYDFSESASFKAQYDHLLIRNQPSVNGITGQVTFTF
jgi:hypothetical protein